MTDQPDTEVSRIDAPFKAAGLADISVSPDTGLWLKTMPQMIELAKIMSRWGVAIAPHCRGDAALCHAILCDMSSWHLTNPRFVANNSYVVTQKRRVGDHWEDVETLAYTSAVFQAALKASGAIIGPPEYYYEGEGQERRCTVRVQDRRTGRWQEHVSPPLRLVHPGHNEKGYVRGSPSWDRDPDQQLGYHTLRALTRLKYQDVMSGFYDRDEYQEFPIGEVEPATPNLLERLPGRIEGNGFRPDAGEAERQEREAVQSFQLQAEAARRERKQAKGKGMPPTATEKTLGAAAEMADPIPSAAEGSSGEPVSGT